MKSKFYKLKVNKKILSKRPKLEVIEDEHNTERVINIKVGGFKKANEPGLVMDNWSSSDSGG